MAEAKSVDAILEKYASPAGIAVQSTHDDWWEDHGDSVRGASIGLVAITIVGLALLRFLRASSRAIAIGKAEGEAAAERNRK